MLSVSLPKPADASRARLGVLLVAHGSRHPGVSAALEEQRRLLAVELAERDIAAETSAGFLDHQRPRAAEAGARLLEGGCDDVVVVPLLLAEAFHARTDLPTVADELRHRAVQDARSVLVEVAGTIGDHPALLAHGHQLLGAALAAGCDGAVVAVTGTRDPLVNAAQLKLIRRAAGATLPAHRVEVAALTGDRDGPAEALERLVAAGVRAPAWLSWSLLPGTLSDVGLVVLRAACLRLATHDVLDLGRLGPSEPVARALADRLVGHHGVGTGRGRHDRA